MGKSKPKLKSLLQTQQTRFKAKEKAGRAAEAAEAKEKAKKRSKSTAQKTITNPFKSTDEILLIGEGDFSFARALLARGIPGSNVTATTIDSEEECFDKYPGTAPDIVGEVKERGVEVVFGVDGMKLDKPGVKLKGRKWDKVVWNFPHSGSGESDLDRSVRANQDMLLAFFRGVKGLLKDGNLPLLGKNEENTRGTVLVTLRNVVPYTLWDMPRLAKKPPAPNPQYILFRSFEFDRNMWEGYEHRMTKGDRAHGTGKTGQGGEDRTWEFYIKDIDDN